jgi:hypothetical protein
MILKSEDCRTAFGFVATNSLKPAGSIVHGMRQHVNFGIVPVHQRSIHPDFIDFFDRHNPSAIIDVASEGE